MNNQALERINHNLVSKRDMGTQILAAGANVDQLTRHYIVACQNPRDGIGEKLQACPREEHYRAFMLMCAYGLPPNGEDAALIPYGKTISYQPMVGGYLKLLQRNGTVHDFHVITVYDGDCITIRSGLVPLGESPWEHTWGDGLREQENFLYGVAFCWLNGDRYWKSYKLSLAELKKREAKASGGKGGSPAYFGWWDSMAQSKAARYACERLPIDFDHRDTMTTHDLIDTGEADVTDLESEAAHKSAGALPEKPVEDGEVVEERDARAIMDAIPRANFSIISDESGIPEGRLMGIYDGMETATTEELDKLEAMQ